MCKVTNCNNPVHTQGFCHRCFDELTGTPVSFWEMIMWLWGKKQPSCSDPNCNVLVREYGDLCINCKDRYMDRCCTICDTDADELNEAGQCSRCELTNDITKVARCL